MCDCKHVGERRRRTARRVPRPFLQVLYGLQRPSHVMLILPRALSSEDTEKNTPRRDNNIPGSKTLQSPVTINGGARDDLGRVYGSHHK